MDLRKSIVPGFDVSIKLVNVAITWAQTNWVARLISMKMICSVWHLAWLFMFGSPAPVTLSRPQCNAARSACVRARVNGGPSTVSRQDGAHARAMRGGRLARTNGARTHTHRVAPPPGEARGAPVELQVETPHGESLCAIVIGQPGVLIDEVGTDAESGLVYPRAEGIIHEEGLGAQRHTTHAARGRWVRRGGSSL